MNRSLGSLFCVLGLVSAIVGCSSSTIPGAPAANQTALPITLVADTSATNEESTLTADAQVKKQLFKATLTGILAETEQQVEKGKDEVSTLDGEVSSRLSHLDQQGEAFARSLTEAKVRKEELHDRVDSVSFETKGVLEDITQKEAETEKEKQLSEDAMRKTEDLVGKTNTLGNEIKSLQSRVSTRKQEYSSLQTEVSKLEGEKQSLQDKIADSSAQVKFYNAEIPEIEAENEELKKKLPRGGGDHRSYGQKVIDHWKRGGGLW